jgi:hypothetical protein
MEKYFVTKEEAKALAEIGCKFDTPFYYGLSEKVNFNIEAYTVGSAALHTELIYCNFGNFQSENYLEHEILAPTYAEALDWFRNKGEVFKVDVELVGNNEEYTAYVMKLGEFITAGKFSSYNEAERCVLNFYINVEIENKIYELEKLKKK